MVAIPCLCPPKGDDVRHPDGDTVNLRERLDFRAALTARNAIVIARSEDPEAGLAEIAAVLSELYVLLGVESWTLVDEKNKPVEVSKVSIRQRLFTDLVAASIVAEAADERYSEAVMRPLLERASQSSPPTPAEASTSATNGTTPHVPPTRSKSPSRAHPRQSKRSSTSTTPTGVTVTTSSPRDGDSRSSPSTATAA